MLRKIIKIDEEKCNGCGLCATACHEGAIEMIDGKAKLVRENFCDGLGDCLPACPTGAITFEEREAEAYDEAAVKKSQMGAGAGQAGQAGQVGGCPGSQVMQFGGHANHGGGCPGSQFVDLGGGCHCESDHSTGGTEKPVSQLSQWPCQIKLVPTQAPFFEGARLLIAADCTAYAYASIHQDFMKGRITLIGCPKLDEGDYSQKLTHIIASNDIKEVTVLRMEVPCCGGLQRAVETALKDSGKFIPWQVVTISRDGRIL